MKKKKRFTKLNVKTDSLSSYKNEFSSHDKTEQKIKRRSLRVYKNKILHEEHGNRQLESWLNFIFGNNHSSNSNQSIEKRDFVFFLPAVLAKIIFQYCADSWDPYNLFNERGETKKRKSPSQENNLVMFLDVVSTREKTSLLCVVPTHSNINEMDKKKYILTVVAKEKLDWQEGEVGIYYQIQRWDVTTLKKIHEIKVECFNNKWFLQVQLELNVPKKQVILFSSQFFYHGKWIVYIYDLETCIGKEFNTPSLSCIGGIYENQLVYSYRSETFRINKIDLTTNIRIQQMFATVELYNPWRIHLLKYHPNFISLFYLTKYESTLQKVEIWNHSRNMKEPIATFDKCDEIWEFGSFPLQKETKKAEIILGVCCCEKKKIALKLIYGKFQGKKI